MNDAEMLGKTLADLAQADPVLPAVFTKVVEEFQGNRGCILTDEEMLVVLYFFSEGVKCYGEEVMRKMLAEDMAKKKRKKKGTSDADSHD